MQIEEWKVKNRGNRYRLVAVTIIMTLDSIQQYIKPIPQATDVAIKGRNSNRPVGKKTIG